MNHVENVLPAGRHYWMSHWLTILSKGSGLEDIDLLDTVAGEIRINACVLG